MIVYIAGKMTGLQDLGYAAFDRAEHKLTGLGYQVLNPAWLGKGLPKETYMPICLSMLQQADAIVMLDGWDDSPGARLEKAFAEYQEMAVYRLAEDGLAPLCECQNDSKRRRPLLIYRDWIVCQNDDRCGVALEEFLRLIETIKANIKAKGEDPERFEERFTLRLSDQEGEAFYLGFQLDEKEVMGGECPWPAGGGRELCGTGQERAEDLHRTCGS